MIVQITDYGVSVLNDTHLPFTLKEYQLGSSYGYSPQQTATGIQGTLQKTGTVSSYEPVNGNTVKYRIGLDYDTPSFTFGEIALFDDQGKCVAICVSSQELETLYKTKSIVIDIYLSMVGTNYVMWTDDLTSSNTFSVPVIETVDALYPVSETTSNLYVVKPTSTDKTAILAYTTKQGLWNFDVYQYKNTATLTVVDCTPTSITVDVSKYSLEELNDIIPKYFGEIIVEFSSGPLYSICRNVRETRLLGNNAVISFATPIAKPCWGGDTVMIFGRTVLSVADTVVPIATTENIGGVIVGDGLSVTEQGVLSANVLSVQGHTGDVELELEDFPWMHKVAKTGNYEDLINKYSLPIATDKILGGVKTKETGHIYVGPTGVIDLDYDPVLSVNGIQPDPDTGELTIDIPAAVVGLTNPKEIVEGDLNNYTSAGIFYVTQGNALKVVNTPITEDSYFALEVVPMYSSPTIAGNVVQRVTYPNASYVRVFNGFSWTTWAQVLTDAVLPIASATVLGMVRIGNGISIDDIGKISANVTSVFGKTGDIELNAENVSALLQYVFNVQGGVPQLSKNPNPSEDETVREQQDWLYGRIDPDQLPFGTLYYYGTWDPESGEVNGQNNVTLINGGIVKTITTNTYEDENGQEVTETDIEEKVMSGAVIKVITSSSKELDGITNWEAGDIIVSLPARYTQLNNTWIKLKDNQILKSVTNKVSKPITDGVLQKGLVYMNEEGKSSAITSIVGGTF